MTEDSGKAYSDITTACRKKDPGKRAALHFFFFFLRTRARLEPWSIMTKRGKQLVNTVRKDIRAKSCGKEKTIGQN